MALKAQGLDIKSAKEKYKEKFLEYNDKRLTKILEGLYLTSHFLQYNRRIIL